MDDTGFALAREGHVAILKFCKPDRMNALTKEQMMAFGQACRDLATDPDVRCVVITGAGRGFCAGADVKADAGSGDGGFATPTRFKDTPLDFITPLLNLPKPSIAAVNGIAVGAGLGIALACDIRICGESGSFLANFCDLGLSAVDGVPWLLTRLAGVPRALEMLYLGEKVDARRAEAAGIVNRVVPDVVVMEEAMAVAHRIAAKSPVAIQMTKAAVLGGAGRSWPDALAQQEFAYLSTIAFSASDIAELWKARAEARAPAFRCSIPFDAGKS
jgi:enoyl-CoA hydratase/carnithine racemase